MLDKNHEAVSLFILFVKQKPEEIALHKDYIAIKMKSSLLEDLLIKCDIWDSLRHAVFQLSVTLPDSKMLKWRNFYDNKPTIHSILETVILQKNRILKRKRESANIGATNEYSRPTSLANYKDFRHHKYRDRKVHIKWRVHSKVQKEWDLYRKYGLISG